MCMCVYVSSASLLLSAKLKISLFGCSGTQRIRAIALTTEEWKPDGDTGEDNNG